MSNSYNNFEKNESVLRNSPMIKERVSLVTAHMVKQFKDYQDSNLNTNEIFLQMIDYLSAFCDALKQSFSSRGIAPNNIKVDIDSQKTVAVFTIFWHQFSFTTRCNYVPQSLFRGDSEHPLFSGRIMAIKGSYFDICGNKKLDVDEEMKLLLESEVASLFVPADKNQNTIFKMKHRANREFYLSQIDAAREVSLTVIETICGSNLYHKEGTIKTFNI